MEGWLQWFYSLLCVLFSLCTQPGFVDKEEQTTNTTMAQDHLAAANNKFGLDLFKVVRKSNQNGFLSPLSISSALAMTQIGARQKTALDMAQVLGWGKDNGEKIHKQFQTYFETLKQASEEYKLSSANRIYMQESFAILEEFKNKTKEFYLAEPVQAKFQADPEGERVKINSWVEDQTQKKIQDLLPSGTISPTTRMVLVNAIYFKGKWEKEFDEHSTSNQPFKLSSGETVDVPTMIQKELHGFYKDDELKCSAIELRYKGGHLAMFIILPNDHNGLEKLVEKLTPEKLDALVKEAAANRMKIQLFLPKFEMTSDYFLSQPLSSMGMSDAFSEANADFSGMTGQRDLFISEVAHKAFVQVNEEGTEAAAATGAVMMMRCAPMPVPPVKVDHPFLFIISDSRANDSVLFMGQMTSSYFLSQPLSSMGMSDAFNEAKADFSGMTGQRDLCVSEVVHKAFVQVNEEGTEAAAATAVVMVGYCAAPPTPLVKVDHPFLFIISDSRANDSVLFMGLVENPKL